MWDKLVDIGHIFKNSQHSLVVCIADISTSAVSHYSSFWLFSVIVSSCLLVYEVFVLSYLTRSKPARVLNEFLVSGNWQAVVYIHIQ